MVIDPVCLKRVNEREAPQRSSFRGQTYYFDCERCRRVFETDPDEYAGRIPRIVYGDQGRKYLKP
jgi:YHS domain-containing protein